MRRDGTEARHVGSGLSAPKGAAFFAVNYVVTVSVRVCQSSLYEDGFDDARSAASNALGAFRNETTVRTSPASSTSSGCSAVGPGSPQSSGFMNAAAVLRLASSPNWKE